MSNTCDQFDDLLLEFVEGALAGDDAELVREHVRLCAACHAKLRDARELFGELSAARSLDNRVHRPASGLPGAQRDRTHIGDFEIEKELGRGGMGIVYRARQISLNRIVALKVLAVGIVQSERAIARFRKEAQAAARLHHTNIVPVYAQGQEDDLVYYAMELIEGKSLGQLLRDDPEALHAPHHSTAGAGPARAAYASAAAEASTVSADAGDGAAAMHADDANAASHEPHREAPRTGIGGMLSGTFILPRVRSGRDYKRVARLFAEVAGGLHHAHQQNIVHRDIKPQNLLLGRDDKLHITDFGLARLMDEPGLTVSNELVGTPAYMSPEQISGGGKLIDHRTDIYSLGVTLYEVLAGKRPFEGPLYNQIIDQVLHREPMSPRRLDSQIPIDLETICLRAMEKDPARRFSTADEMARDLLRYAEDFPIASRRVGLAGKCIRWTRRHPARAAAIAGVIAVVVLAPLLLLTIAARDADRVLRAYDISLENYHDFERARAELSRLSWFAGQTRERVLAEAFASVSAEPLAAVRMLESALKRWPNDREARYLLAWARMRCVREQGAFMGELARRDIAIADSAHTLPAGGAAFFFRGQALLMIDPEAARRSFDEAIVRRQPRMFPQAMLHAARAANQIMYAFRDRSYYVKTVSGLEMLMQLDPNRAYVPYLLSVTHMIQAEILAADSLLVADPDEGARLTQDAERAYAESFAVAAAAIRKNPENAYGYKAAAGYHESRREFDAAIGSWNSIPVVALAASSDLRREQSAYCMRLHFWRSDYERAESDRRTRYEKLPRYDPDEAIFGALLAATTGDRARARRVLRDGAEQAGGNAEHLLVIDAAWRLIGESPPDGLLSRATDFTSQISLNWDETWLRALYAYRHGEIDWNALLTAAQTPDRARIQQQQLLAGAYFIRGAEELRLGDRSAAIASLRSAWRQYDFEHYCFIAKLLVVKMELDSNWPPWLSEQK